MFPICKIQDPVAAPNQTLIEHHSFHGEVVEPDTMSNPAKREKFDLGAFLARNSKANRRDEIFQFAKDLKAQYKKVGAIGFCWGAWPCLQLGAKGNNLLDCTAVAHATMAEKSEIEALGVPTQVMAAETDTQFTPELKQFTVETLPKLGIPYEYLYFPGVVHGFAIKGDGDDPKQKEALERAKNLAVNFFKEYLSDKKQT